MRQMVQGLGTSVEVNRECGASRPPGRGAVRGLSGVRVRGGGWRCPCLPTPLTCPILFTERVVNADLLQTVRSVAARIGVRSDQVGFVLPDEIALLE